MTKNNKTLKKLQTITLVIIFLLLGYALWFTASIISINLDEIVFARQLEDDTVIKGDKRKKIDTPGYSEGMELSAQNGSSKDELSNFTEEELSDIGKPKSNKEAINTKNSKNENEDAKEILEEKQLNKENNTSSNYNNKRNEETENKENQNIIDKKNLTLEKIKVYLRGTELAGLEESLYKISKKYKLNPIFTTAVAALESEYGTAALAKNKNNLFAYNENKKITTNHEYKSFTDENKLESYFKGALKGTGKYFIKFGEKYEIDPLFVAAIAVHETGNGESYAIKYLNNPGGIMNHETNWSTLVKFTSLETGIKRMFDNLKKNYFDKGLDSVSEIGNKYAPIGALNDPKNKNKYWIPNVTKIYKLLEGNNLNSSYENVLSDSNAGQTSYEDFEDFTTKEESIEAFAKLIRTQYLNNGIQNLTVIGERYSDDANWGKNVDIIMKKIEKTVTDENHKVIDKEKLTLNKIKSYLRGTELEGLEENFYKISRKYKINPIFTTAVAILESEDDPSERSFTTKEESIEAFAKLIRTQYLNNGMQNLIVLGERYSGDANWGKNIDKIMKKIEKSRP
ncbi:glucosaminidase domain-containing protein [Oceanirhabdus sp. W0125-5]|uniref:glucosaminidase domain-containing protein n=1 Tax=Oceanirhabdus sp. W0125-5 TaxID=2999116 RepID=UPI0022F2FC87|nr:glucosaminidase domain-containing protein [Oceanirhabdus sp. W0125-5]WBW95026.1 glucosaminidase domain-containing protein [Oceanirhabdus sp. W0125-5]